MSENLSLSMGGTEQTHTSVPLKNPAPLHSVLLVGSSDSVPPMLSKYELGRTEQTYGSVPLNNPIPFHSILFHCWVHRLGPCLPDTTPLHIQASLPKATNLFL